MSTSLRKDGSRREERWSAPRTRGATLWLTGLSGSGKSTIAAQVERLLISRGTHAYRLDGDELRRGLCSDLGFSAEDRNENVRRAGEVARLLADSGAIVVASFISPYEVGRRAAREAHERDGLVFVEVFVDTPIELCEERDPKGLYARARAGEVRGFTGIDDPYESPSSPDLVLRPAERSLEECARECVDLLVTKGLVPGAD